MDILPSEKVGIFFTMAFKKKKKAIKEEIVLLFKTWPASDGGIVMIFIFFFS